MEIRSSLTPTKGKLEQVKRLRNGSYVSDLITNDYESTNKIRFSSVLTSEDLYENILARKTPNQA